MPVPDRRALRLGRGVDVHQVAAVLRRACAREPAPLDRHPRRARAGAARRLGHHRPHLARRLDHGGQPGRPLPDRARRHAEGLQLLRRAPRQPRGDDARHVRQHPPARTSWCPGVEGGCDRARAVGRAHDDLRRVDALPGRDGVPLVVIAGKEYGTGSSRDWAAKGTLLLGVRAVIAESYERIHRSNLVGMGVMPLEFLPGQTAATLGLTGQETLDVEGLADGPRARQARHACAPRRPTASVTSSRPCARVDTPDDVEYYRHGGLLPYVLRGMLRGVARGLDELSELRAPRPARRRARGRRVRRRPPHARATSTPAPPSSGRPTARP